MLRLMRRPKFWIWPYNGGSNAAQSLANAIGGRVIKRKNSKYKRSIKDRIINWGASVGFDNGPMANEPLAVRRAVSKMETFRILADAGVPVPSWTKDKRIANDWIQRGRVIGRDLDKGSRGRGITVYEKGGQLGDHLFYVRYMRKDRELRVHVMNGTVIFVQEKLKKKGVENVDKYIRSHNRGWCFAFHHFEEQPIPQIVLDSGVAAVRALGLDFGAADIAWSERSGATILEVNTAPGLEKSSLAAYANAFQRAL